MILPSGSVVKRGLEVQKTDFSKLFHELKDKLFNGYICLAIQGFNGFEEGILVFESGKVYASFYDYLNYNKQFYGDSALKRFLNATACKKGVVDVFQLPPDQVQVILAFNENAICSPLEKDLFNLQIKTFSQDFELEVLKSLEAEPDLKSKVALLKKFKLNF